MNGIVITLATSKGGAGKSTLARNLAAHWMGIGMRVSVIDADPQGSIISHHNPEGPLKDLTVHAEPEEGVSSLIEELRSRFDFVIVDTGGFRNRTTVRALVETDLVLIPLKPSADDVAVALEMNELVADLNKTPEREGKPIDSRMVLTMTQNGTVIARHVRRELEENGYPLLKAEMYLRVAYPENAINGSSPCVSDPDGPASRDIAHIVKELQGAACFQKGQLRHKAN
jgi:chromosome partitioning protein